MRFALVLVGLALCGTLHAQHGTMPRVALFDPGEQAANIAEDRNPYWSAMFSELRILGHVEGKTVVYERWGGSGDATREGQRRMGAKIVASNPTLVVIRGQIATRALLQSSKTIPIVIIGSVPPEAVVSLARPGKNLTGINTTFDDSRLYAKQLQYLREVSKAQARVAWLGPKDLWDTGLGESARTGAKSANLMLRPVFIDSPITETTIRHAFATIKPSSYDALYISPSAAMFPQRSLIGRLALESGLPSVGPARPYAEAGATFSYGPDYVGLYRRLAHQVDKVLRGTAVGDIPMEQPDKILLVVNARAVKQLRVPVPQSLLIAADEVIQ